MPYVMKRGPAPCRDALQEANGVREGPRVPSLTYWTVYTPCVFMAPDYTCLSLSRERYIYIYRISSDAHRRMPPHLRDKRTKLVVTNIAKREGMSNEILFESSFSLKIPFVSRNGGKGTRVSLRYTLRQGARRESARGGEGG